MSHFVQGDLITELLMDIAYPAMYINKLIHSLRVLDATGKLPSCRTKTLPGGQKAVQVCAGACVTGFWLARGLVNAFEPTWHDM